MYCATQNGEKGDGKDPKGYRKPLPGMWTAMQHHMGKGTAVDMPLSFFVGDAAARANDHRYNPIGILI